MNFRKKKNSNFFGVCVFVHVSELQKETSGEGPLRRLAGGMCQRPCVFINFRDKRGKRSRVVRICESAVR